MLEASLAVALAVLGAPAAHPAKDATRIVNVPDVRKAASL
jgi:hypothetical protein